MPEHDHPAWRMVAVRRLGAARDGSVGFEAAAATEDAVAAEEPLEIRIGPASLAVLVRTPGHDEELALGFAITERIVADAADVQSVRHSSSASVPEAADNVVQLHLAPHVSLDAATLKRNLLSTSSCGLCGKASIQAALAVAPPLHDDPSRVAAGRVATFPALLASGQEGFHRTGGLHAAALLDPAGTLLVVREDIGRHNAVDKVVGWAASRGLLPLRGHALVVSGRISFEIAQKALAARIPVVAAVSAPSSLAVQLAEDAGMALVGFLRERAMNVYGATWRVPGATTEAAR